MSDKICIISGSTMGSAEYVAASINDFLEEQGFDTIMFHGPSIEEIVEFHKIIIVSSTYGEGDIPDNIKPLIEAINSDSENLLDYKNIKLLVIGLGSTDYDLFCNCVDIIQQAFSKHNVFPVTSSKCYDMSNFDIDPEEDAPIFVSQHLEKLLNK